MLESEKLAIAAHLHVLLRRKTGRVTDTEWMASNAEYAREVMRFARGRAKEDGHVDLAEWADKLEGALGLGGAKPVPRHPPTEPDAMPSILPPMGSDDVESPRYVRGIR